MNQPTTPNTDLPPLPRDNLAAILHEAAGNKNYQWADYSRWMMEASEALRAVTKWAEGRVIPAAPVVAEGGIPEHWQDKAKQIVSGTNLQADERGRLAVMLLRTLLVAKPVAPAVVAEGLTDERAEFQAWLGRPMMNPAQPSHYNGRDVRTGWEAWQERGRRMATLPSAPTAMEVPHGHTEDEDCNCEAVGYAKGWNALLAAHPVAGSPAEAEQHLANLLARVHRDGGHRQAEIGTVAAVEEADIIVANFNAASDAAEPMPASEACKKTPEVNASAVHVHGLNMPTSAAPKQTMFESFSRLLEIQRSEAASGDPYMVGLYNGMAMMCGNLDGICYEMIQCAAPVPASEAAIGAGDPMAFFADFCDREGYPSDGEMDAALKGAFYEGIRYCANLAAPAAPTDAKAAAEKGVVLPIEKDIRAAAMAMDLTDPHQAKIACAMREVAANMPAPSVRDAAQPIAPGKEGA